MDRAAIPGAADADIRVAVEGRHALEVTLYGEVTATYITLRTLEQRIASAEKNVEIQQETGVAGNQFRAR